MKNGIVGQQGINRSLGGCATPLLRAEVHSLGPECTTRCRATITYTTRSFRVCCLAESRCGVGLSEGEVLSDYVFTNHYPNQNRKKFQNIA